MTEPVRRPIDLRLVGVAGGVWSASLLGLWLTADAGLWVGLGATASAGIVAVAQRQSPRVIGWAVIAILLGVACGAWSTAARVAIRDAQPLAALVTQRTTAHVEATVTDDPHLLAGPAGRPTFLVPARLTQVVTAREQVRLDVDVVIFAADAGWATLLPSQRLAVEATIGPAQAGSLTAAVLNVHTAPDLIGTPSWTQTVAGRLRAGLRAACAGLPDGPGGLLPGLVIGDTSGVTPAIREEFRVTGLTHLLAVSGANVAIVLGVVLFLARWCRATPAAAAAICLVALLGFVVLARPSPSVIRAAGMGLVGLLALVSGRRAVAMPALATTVVLALLWDPGLAVDPGFALSTVATGALVLLAPRWRDGLRSRGVPPVLAEAIAVPAAAQVACGPIIAMLAGGVSLIAVPANLLAAPAVAPATLLGVAATIVHPLWSAGAAGLAWLAGWPARWLLTVAHTGAGVPFGTIGWPAGVVGGALLAVVTVALIRAVRRPAARAALLVGVLAVGVGAVPIRVLASGWPPAGAVLVVCDVGQGDALVLPVAEHEAVVVDAGPEPSAVDGCLRRLDVSTVDLLVLTHFHLDHVGGVAGVVQGRRVGGLLESPFTEPAEGAADVAGATAGVPVLTASPGWAFVRGGLTLRVVGPAAVQTGTRSDPNNNSVVLRAESGGVSMLLAGDAEIEEQQQLLALDPGALPADVLKVAHHGSAYQDPAFLDAVAPRLALVSVGAGNPYGHPNLAVLARLSSRGATVLRTDQQGDLAVVATSSGLAVATRAPP